MRRLLTALPLRRLFAVAVGVCLLAAILWRWQLIVDATAQLRTLSATVLGALAFLTVLDRLLRADLIRSLLPKLSLARAELVSDVGAAVSKGLPLGGPVATVLRWQIAKERDVDAVGFATMLIASGVATAFVGWTLVLASTTVDTATRQTDAVDLAIIAVSIVVLVGALCFWAFVLGSDRPQRWIAKRSSLIIGRLEAVIPALADTDPETTVANIRTDLRTIAGAPVPLMTRTTLAHINGTVILWLALQALAVGPELEVTEFARVFFVTHIIGSFAPTPGGVGLVEAGLAGALIAAGVASSSAIAAVLIYRFITFLVPIIVGSVLYVVWKQQLRSGPE